MASLLAVDEAKARLLGGALAVGDSESVALAEAHGRILADDLIARLTQPPFDAAAMDGYALRAADAVQAGAELAVIGTAAAGHAFCGALGKGEAVRIFTGAPVPVGVDTILLQEDAETIGGDRVRVAAAVAPGRHIRPRGQDFIEGEALLKAGHALTFADLTLAAAMDHATLAVYRKPLIAILATGDELVLPGQPRQAAQIVASSGFGVAALARQAGADLLDLGVVADNAAAIGTAAAKAAEAGADVLVTLGGASVGDHDLVQAALKARGMALDFWRIAMRPGKPLMVGAIGTMQVLGLPGNPVASLVCALIFLEPLVSKLARRPAPKRERAAIAATPLKANDHRQDFLRARMIGWENGTPLVKAYERQDSSMMRILAASDCLILRPPHAPELAAGGECRVILLNP